MDARRPALYWKLLAVPLAACLAATAGEISSAGAQEPVQRRAAAHFPPPAIIAQMPAPRTISERTPEEMRITAALDQPVEFAYDETPIADVARDLSKRTKLQVVLDMIAFNHYGKGDRLTHLSGGFRGGSLRSGLQNLLDPYDMGYLVTGDRLLFTSKSFLETATPRQVYQVHDLVPPGTPADRFNALVHLIEASVQPETWRRHGGTQGEIKPYDAPGLKVLVVAQTGTVHDEVEALLTMLRAARDQPLPAEGSYIASPDDLRIHRLLDLPARFEYTNTSLRDVAADLEKRHGMTVKFDWSALTADGKDLPLKVSGELRDGSLRAGLKRLLQPLDLKFIVRHGGLSITTPSGAEMWQPLRVYPVGDLAQVAPDGGSADLEPLVELIRSTIQPETWIDGQDIVGLAPYSAAGVTVLVVYQTEDVHEELATLLKSLRAARTSK